MQLTPRHKRRGFTLIEVIVAMALTAVVMSLMMSSMVGTSDQYGSLNSQIDTRVEARATMSLLARDVGGYSGDWTMINQQASNGWALDEFSFLSRQSLSAQDPAGAESDLCRIFYYSAVTIDDGSEADVSRKLYRRIESSAETFDSLVEGRVERLPGKNPMSDEPVAYGVVSIDMIPLIESGGQIREWSENDSADPTFVDIILVVTHRQLLGRLRSNADWESASGPLGSPDDVDENENLHVYKTRLQL